VRRQPPGWAGRRGRLWLGALCLLGAVGVAGWLGLGHLQKEPASPAMVRPSPPGWQQAGGASPFGVGEDAALRRAPAAEAPLGVRLGMTSLAGTQVDGAWPIDTRGRLRADRALRARFDYYLSLLGERPQSDLRDLLRQDARAHLPPETVDQALALWDSYVALQQYRWQRALDLRDPARWGEVLAERQTVRRALLGADWAQAFYAGEEQTLAQMIARVNSGAQPGGQSAETMAAERMALPSRLPDADQREAELKTQWADWERRLVDARQEVQRLQTAVELSGPQREQAIARYLAENFGGGEQIRARALLGL